jgi:DNA-binding CsgD family transcriptional regulator
VHPPLSGRTRIATIVAMDGLTHSERRLLKLLLTPLSFAQIGRLLGRPRDVVETEAIALYRKLGAVSDP